jgi:hypothetical protein
LRLARWKPTLGNGQLVAENEYLDVLARLGAPGQPHPSQQFPHHDIDQLQRQKRRSSHVTRVIGSYNVT